MKNLFAFALAFTMALFFSTVAFSQTAEPVKSMTDKNVIEDNYLAGLNSDNFGVVTDCIYYLGKMRSGRAVKPLIKILNDKFTFNAVRLMAALSLLQIENPAGVSAVQYASENCDCEQIKTLCRYFHKIHSIGDSYQNLAAQLNIEIPKW